MQTTALGRSGLKVTRTAFGALPIQRVAKPEAVRILRRAFDAGITFYDTARAYSDSEEKLGETFAAPSERDQIVIATKSGAPDAEGFSAHLETSLRLLKTDRVDIMQLHNPGVLPAPDDKNSPLHAMLRARGEGKIRFIGITSHNLERARDAVNSGIYDTLQYPLSALSAPEEFELVELCRRTNTGFIAMKALAGGLLNHAAPAFAFLRQLENVVPIWGIQRMSELEEFIALEASPPPLDAAMLAEVERDKAQLGPSFCRACGYCLPCPAQIPIPMAARMPLLLRRSPPAPFLGDDWKARMRLVNNCLDCGRCRVRCPYNLDPPALLRAALADYENFKN